MLSTAEIDSSRLSSLKDLQDVTTEDAAAVLTRIGQHTLSALFRHSRKPIESEMVSAAAQFFQSFYLRESPIDFNPRAVLVACMNLGAKTEEFHSLTLSDLVNALPDAVELKLQVPRIELRLLAALDFNLVIDQPWMVLLFWANEILGELGNDSSVHLKVFDISCDLMRTWQWTDAVLIFPFPKLATAVTLRACIVADSQLRSPEEESEPLQACFIRIVENHIPGVNVRQLLDDVEAVVYRFGRIERLLKDPSIEQTVGFKQLTQRLAPL
jgi:hypothetical protein